MEEGLAVGWVGDGRRVAVEREKVVPGVCNGVAEAEDGVVTGGGGRARNEDEDCCDDERC